LGFFSNIFNRVKNAFNRFFGRVTERSRPVVIEEVGILDKQIHEVYEDLEQYEELEEIYEELHEETEYGIYDEDIEEDLREIEEDLREIEEKYEEYEEEYIDEGYVEEYEDYEGYEESEEGYIGEQVMTEEQVDVWDVEPEVIEFIEETEKERLPPQFDFKYDAEHHEYTYKIQERVRKQDGTEFTTDITIRSEEPLYPDEIWDIWDDYCEEYGWS